MEMCGKPGESLGESHGKLNGIFMELNGDIREYKGMTVREWDF